MTVRFALLGAGRIGKSHARAIDDNPDATLVAVYDPVKEAAQAMADHYHCEIYTMDEMETADDIDVVAICTPTDTHADLIEKYARAGKVIFCEKPIDLDIRRVKSCLKTVQDTGARLMVGFNRRFDKHFKALQNAIIDGEIGDIEQIIITSRDPDLPPLDYIAVSGSIFRDMTIHDIDMARFLLGDDDEINSVYATGSVLVDSNVKIHGDYDSAMLVMRTTNDKLIHINNSRRASYGYDQRIEVHGNKGMAAAHNPNLTLCNIANSSGFHRPPLHNFFMTRYAQAYAEEISMLTQAVINDTPLKPTGKDGLMALAIADAALKSAQTGQIVKLSETL